jgi:copper chaperone CopZ
VNNAIARKRVKSKNLKHTNIRETFVQNISYKTELNMTPFKAIKIIGMKKILLLAPVLVFLYACNPTTKKTDLTGTVIDSARVTSVVLKVEGMTCNGCEQTICKAVGQLPGVTEVTASYIDSVATIRYDPGVSAIDEISKKIEEAGYKVLASQ